MSEFFQWAVIVFDEDFGRSHVTWCPSESNAREVAGAAAGSGQLAHVVRRWTTFRHEKVTEVPNDAVRGCK